MSQLEQQNTFDFNGQLKTTYSQAKIDIILVQKQDILCIQSCLNKMKFSKLSVDFPSIFYGASLTCLISAFIYFIQQDNSPATASLFLSIICFVLGLICNLIPSLSSNTTNNKKDHEYAKESIDRIVKSSTAE